MNRTTLLVVGVVSILGVSACSGDNKLSVTSSKQQTPSTAANSGSASADSTGSSGGGGGTTDGSPSLPDLTGVAGLSGNCTAYLTAIASAFTPDASGAAGLAKSFDKLESQVPDNLKADVRVLGDGFAKLQKLYEKYNYDYTKIATDPEAATLFSDSAFAKASTNVTAWLNTECPTG